MVPAGESRYRWYRYYRRKVPRAVGGMTKLFGFPSGHKLRLVLQYCRIVYRGYLLFPVLLVPSASPGLGIRDTDGRSLAAGVAACVTFVFRHSHVFNFPDSRTDGSIWRCIPIMGMPITYVGTLIATRCSTSAAVPRTCRMVERRMMGRRAVIFKKFCFLVFLNFHDT